jgi:hypothetical protein
MHPYTKQLTIDEALNLEKVNKTALACHSRIQHPISNPDKIAHWAIHLIYKQGDYLSCDALTYATYILNQATPPEGYGYAAYELSSGRYDELPYYLIDDEKKWIEGRYSEYQKTDATCKNDWYRYAFRLTDLARVEGTDTDKTEINAAQLEWLHYKTFVIKHFKNEELFEDQIFDFVIADAKKGCKIELLTSTYNALPQEFKDLAISKMETSVTDWEAKYKQEKSECERLRKALFESEAKYNKAFLQRNEKDLQKQIADLEAKNKELANAGLNIAYDLATGSQSNEKNLLDRIAELEKTIDSRENQIDKQQSQISKLITAYERKLDALGSLQAVEIDLQAILNEVQPLLPF